MSSFKVNPNNYLGSNYADYKSDVYSLALSKPAVYFDMRKTVIQKVKRDAVENIYKVFYDILNEGVVKGDKLIKDTNGNPIAPQYPEHLINEECLGASKTLDEMCEHIVNIILPREINSILSDKLGKIGKSEIP